MPSQEPKKNRINCSSYLQRSSRKSSLLRNLSRQSGPSLTLMIRFAETTTRRLTIKGRPSDDAVLCTPTTTFLLRTVQISNSLVILRPPPPPPSTSTSSPSIKLLSLSRPTLEVRDVCHEILECVPQAANLERIRTVLKPSQWAGLGKRKRDEGRRWTRAQLESVVQGSEGEFKAGLSERNVVEVEGGFGCQAVQA